MENLVWEDLPAFAVITGRNGAGKSQLLEVLASNYGALKNPKWRVEPPKVIATGIILGETFNPGEVFHSYGEWEPLADSDTSESRIRFAIHELQSRRRNAAFIASLAKDIDVSPERLRIMSPREFAAQITPSILWSYAPAEQRSLSLMFLSYRFFQRNAIQRGEDPERVLQFLGEPPWTVLASIIGAAGLSFQFKKPDHLPTERYETDERFDFQLLDHNGMRVPLSQLSSGERVLMSTVLWRYQAEVAHRHYRLLLLDEPDAHLHPSLTRRFLSVLKKVFVDVGGGRKLHTSGGPKLHTR